MALRDELLVPIPGSNPAGVELRYDPVYDKIKEARREDDDAPQGEWQTERKVADWPLVIKLTKDALSKKSKDLQLAVWLTEAMLRREGIAGLRAGLDLIDGMVDQYWDGLFPALAADIAGAVETLQQLDERSQERFGQDAPSFGKLREALEEVRRATAQLLKRKLEVEPDAPEFSPTGVPPEADIGAPPIPTFASAPAASPAPA